MLFKHAARLELLDDVDQLWQGAVETLATVGIDHAVYLNRVSTKSDFRAPLLAPDLPAPFDILSPREREVVYLLAQGQSRKQAADSCGVPIHTVSDYAKSGYHKLGVHNRAQAAAILHGTALPLDE